jgi:seryl-tRNA synthetase
LRKRLLKLEKVKNEELAQELVQGKETISSLKSSIATLQDLYDVLQKTHKDLEVQFDTLWTSTPETNKASTSTGCENAITLILMLFVLKANIPMLSKFLYNLVIEL